MLSDRLLEMGTVGDFPLGIRFWMQEREAGEIPRFYVCECMGKVKGTELYWFRIRGKDYQFVKHIDDLNQKGFRPFLLNMDKLRMDWGVE